MKSKRISKLNRVFAVFMVVFMLFSMLPSTALADTDSGTDYGKVYVIVENTTFTQATEASGNEAPAWTGTLVEKWVDLNADSTMMSCVVEALGDYSQKGAESNYISEINGLSAGVGGTESGWMGTLNDWFTNSGFGDFTVKKGTLEDGDEIRIMYTTNGYGEDLGGSWSNTLKTIKSVSFSAGELNTTFNSDTHEYTLTLPADTTSVKVTPTASNKNYQVKTYLGTQAEGTFYKRTADIPVTDGSVITVVCGDPSWPTMNDDNSGEAQTYTFNVKVGEASSTDSAYLENLAFGSQPYNKNILYGMSADFNEETYDYTVYVPEKFSTVYVWADVPDDYENASLTAEYTNTSGEKTTVAVSNLAYTKGNSLSNAVAANVATGNTVKLTLNADGVEQSVYNITLKRVFTLNKLTLTDSDTDSTYSLSPTFNYAKYAYTSSAQAGAVIKVEPTVYLSDAATATVRGTTDNKFVVKYDENHESKIYIDVTAEGAETLTYTVAFTELPKLVITSAPDKTEYNIGDTFDTTGLKAKAVYGDGTETELDLTSSDVTISPSGAIKANSTFSISYKGVSAEIAGVTINRYAFKGSGTEEEPYLLENAADLKALSDEVNAGDTFKGKYFKITSDITLPDDWTPIGGLQEGKTYTPTATAANQCNTFNGYIDGAKSETENYKITVPSGSKSLIGCPQSAKFSNIDIYGEKINGYGFVEYYCNGSSCTIDNVNIKSGSNVKLSGLIGGYASGTNAVAISNCTVEEKVTIGNPDLWDDLTDTYNYAWGPGTVQYNDMVGSFAGAFNGTIRNCVSYATVYGRNYVGGIVGFKGQSMGDFVIDNCTFAGDVIATGDYAGGIAGSGYSASSAPNTSCVTIQNCLVTGSVKANDCIGGIIGGNGYIGGSYNNGIGYIRGNLVTGSLTAISENAKIGGVIGYVKSLNRYNIIKNNYYLESIADAGVGEIGTDSSLYYTKPVAVTSAKLKDGSVTSELNNAGAGNNVWEQGDKTPVLTNNKRVYRLVSSGLNPMTAPTWNSSVGYDYYGQEKYAVTVYYTDGTTETVSPADAIIINAPDFENAGLQVCSLKYKGCELYHGVTVKVDSQNTDPEYYAVNISVLGDTLHSVDKDNVHTLAGNNLTQWVADSTVVVKNDATAYDVLEKAAKAYGFEFVADDTGYGKYVSSVTMNGVTLDATSNKQSDGKSYSGWMFTVNGESVFTSLDNTKVASGDKILFYFEDDYSLAYVDAAITAIKAIPTTITKENKDKVTEAENALLYLSPIAMDKVKADESYKLLTEAQTKLADVKAFEDAINALPSADNVKLTDKASIEAAKKLYAELSEENKALVNDDALKVLDSLESRISDMQGAKDEAKKDAVAEIQNSAADLSEYRLAEQVEVLSLMVKSLIDMENAEDADAIGTALEAFKSELAAIKTDADYNIEELSSAAVTLTVKASDYKTAVLTWKAVENAEKYEVYRSTAKNSGYEKIATTSKASLTDSKLKTGTVYYYKVKAYAKIKDTDVYSKYSSVKSVKPALSKVSGLKVKSGKAKATVSWSKVSGATGYKIYRSTKKSSGFKCVKTITKSSTVKYTNKKLKKGKTYYYKVRAYKTVDGKKVYSPYSTVKKVKVSAR